MKLVIAVASVVLLSTLSYAQQPLRHLSGVDIAEKWASSAERTTLSATLRFVARDGGPSATIEYRASYRGPARDVHDVPAVVDVIVSQHPEGAETPTMAVVVDGRPQSLAARVMSSRAVAATISFDEFVRLANADALVQEAFGGALEFSQGQLRMLRNTAARWSGAVPLAVQADEAVGTWTGTWDGAGSGNFELTLDKTREGAPVGRVAVTTDGGNYSADLKSIAVDKQKLTAKYEFPLDTSAEVFVSATFEGKDAKGTWALRAKGQDTEIAAGTFALTKK